MKEPATKQDLDEAIGTLHGEMQELKTGLRGEMQELKMELRGEMRELKTELRGEIQELGGALRTEMKAMKVELINAMGDAAMMAATHAINVAMEQWRGYLGAVDDKYRDLPAQHAGLRAEFDVHASDARLHVRAAAAAPK